MFVLLHTGTIQLHGKKKNLIQNILLRKAVEINNFFNYAHTRK